MIHYLVTADHDYTMRWFLRDWAPALRPRLRIWHYERRPWRRGIPPGAYVFADLERLTDAERAEAGALRERLLAAGQGYRVLNDPLRTFRRYELLQALAARGWNPFRAFRSTEPLDGLRFPVFLRLGNAHEGNLTPLLRDAAELAAAFARVRREQRSLDPDDLLVVEFTDTVGTDGIYRKFSAARVGDRVFPRHLFFSRDWVLKYPDIVEPAFVAEEIAYVEHFPHAERVRAIFELAGVEFGRIDYAVADGGIVTWEINSNATLSAAPAKIAPARRALQRMLADQFTDILLDLDADLPATAPVGVLEQWRVDVVGSVRKKIGGLGPLRRLRRP